MTVSSGGEGASCLKGGGAKAGLPLPRRHEQTQDSHAADPRDGAGVLERRGVCP
jgi:hypothetical protein